MLLVANQYLNYYQDVQPIIIVFVMTLNKQIFQWMTISMNLTEVEYTQDYNTRDGMQHHIVNHVRVEIA